MPSVNSFRKDKARQVLSLGGLFFVCQILFMGIANTNEFFITQYTSPSNVVTYQIYNRLFTLGSMLFMLALTPVWSAVSKGIAEGDYIWLKKLYRNLTKLSILGIIAEFTLILFLQNVVNVWLRDNSIKIDYLYAIIFAAFGSVMIFQSMVSTFTNGMGRIKIQAISYAFGFLIKLLIIHFGIGITGSWIVVVIANFVVLLPYCILQHVDLKTVFEQFNLNTKKTAT